MKTELSSNSQKKSILSVLPLELYPLPTAGCFPFSSKRHRVQIGFKERELKLISWRKMNSQQGNPAVTSTTQGLFLTLPATVTLTPKDRECCTLQQIKINASLCPSDSPKNLSHWAHWPHPPQIWGSGFARRWKKPEGWGTQQTLEVCDPVPKQKYHQQESSQALVSPCKRPKCCSFCSRKGKKWVSETAEFLCEVLEH